MLLYSETLKQDRLNYDIPITNRLRHTHDALIDTCLRPIVPTYCIRLHEITIVVLVTSLVGSMWFLNLLSNQAWATVTQPGQAGLVWQKIQEPLTQDNLLEFRYVYNCLEVIVWLKWVPIILPSSLVQKQWFLNLLSNQAWAATNAAPAWLDRIFKNHWLRIQTVPTTQKSITLLDMFIAVLSSLLDSKEYKFFSACYRERTINYLGNISKSKALGLKLSELLEKWHFFSWFVHCIGMNRRFKNHLILD
jgi:hypothetical protein